MLNITKIKQALKIDYNTDDVELERIKQAVEDVVATYTGLTLCPSDKKQYLSYFMKTRFENAPLLSVSSVKYTAPNGSVIIMQPDDWFLVYSEAPSVFINFRNFPSVKNGTEIEVAYRVGYTQYPPSLEQAIIALVGHYYENPEASAPIGITEVPLSFKFILDLHRVKGSVD